MADQKPTTQDGAIHQANIDSQNGIKQNTQTWNSEVRITY